MTRRIEGSLVSHEHTNPKQEITTLERLEANAEKWVLSFLENEGITGASVTEINKTTKSVFGSVEFGEKKHFFKISDAEKIAYELEGYKIAEDYKHETIHHHYFDAEEGYGLYIQDYCDEVSVDSGLAIHEINSALGKSPEEQKKIEDKLAEVYRKIHEIFESTLTEDRYVLSGRNDAFFHERLKKDGRIDSYYGKRSFKFEDSKKDIVAEELFTYLISCNGEDGIVIQDVIEKAQHDLDPEKPRVFVVSQGDLTESNVSVEGTFFDFEAAGLNSLIQELAIYLVYTYVNGHYITPKYSKSTDQTFSKQFEQSITTEYVLDEESKKMDIVMNYPLPELKRALIERFTDIVIAPIERKLNPAESTQLVKELQSAIALRLIAVKNILKFEEKDVLVTLGLLSKLCKAGDEKTLEEFIKQRFVSI